MSALRRIAFFSLLFALLAALLSIVPSRVTADPALPVAYLPMVNNELSGPSLGGCPMFPANNIWNQRIDSLPVDSHSNAWIDYIGASTHLHPDFSSSQYGGPYGIPYDIVPGSQVKVAVVFGYASESDPGPYPIPPNAHVEGNGEPGDRHVLVLDKDNCLLYEMWNSVKQANGSWHAGSGAVFNLHSNQLRPAGWTSADAAGLPILPGLVRYDEMAAGEILHAIRFTIHDTQAAYLWPARHLTGEINDPDVPPMGARFRLKSSVNLSGFDPQIQVIFRAFQRYGLIVADNGSDWYITGSPDERWDDDLLVSSFRLLQGSDFEAVDVSSLMIDPNSGQSK